MLILNTSKYLDWSEYLWNPAIKESYITLDIASNNFIYREEITRDSSLQNIDDSKKRTLIDSNSIKYLLRITSSIYHVMHDTLPLILKLHSLNPNGVFVLFNFKSGTSLYRYLEEFLTNKKINYVTIDPIALQKNRPSKSTYTVKIFNYIDIEEYLSANKIYLSMDDILTSSNVIRNHIGIQDIVPHRKVYLSRSHIASHISRTSINISMDNRKGYTDDSRMKDQHILEEFFSSLGYEIVIPEEKFSTLKEQIEYMASVKVLASITGSGLTNSLFMREKQTIIEIQTELVHRSDEMQYFQEFMQDYMRNSYIKRHLYIAIPARRDSKEVVELLKQRDTLL